MEDPVKNAIMNKLISEYSQQSKETEEQNVPRMKVHRNLEQVAELPEEEEEEANNSRNSNISGLIEERSGTKSTAHHKGVSDSSSTQDRRVRKNTAQQLFKQELQRRCESLILTSHKLNDEGREEKRVEQDSPSYTELIESRNGAVGQSFLAKSGSTRDTTQGQDETYDVLATIKASQQRQETQTSMNYIIDSKDDGNIVESDEFTMMESPQDFCETANEENTVSEYQKDDIITNVDISVEKEVIKRTHRRTDSSNIDWQMISKRIAAQENEGEMEQEGGELNEQKAENMMMLVQNQNIFDKEDEGEEKMGADQQQEEMVSYQGLFYEPVNVEANDITAADSTMKDGGKSASQEDNGPIHVRHDSDEYEGVALCFQYKDLDPNAESETDIDSKVVIEISIEYQRTINQ